MSVFEVVCCPCCNKTGFIEYIPQMYLSSSFYLCLNCGCRISIKTMKEIKEQERLKNTPEIVIY